MAYHVRTLERAERDLFGIARWLKKRSLLGARRWLLAYEDAKKKLGQTPLTYGRAPEDSRVDFELRQTFFKTPRGKRYRVVFTVVEDEVLILRVRGPHQRPLRRKDLSTD
jgi:plasmid stabilization system protein ParE